MSLVIPPGFVNIQLGFRSTGDPDPYSTAYAFAYDGVAFTPSDALATVDWIFGLMPEGLFSPVLSNSTCTITYASALLPLSSYDVNPTPWTGTGADGIPQNSAYLLNKQAAPSGRQHRGRNYWPGVEESRVDNVGLVDSGTLGALGTFCQAIVDLDGAPSALTAFVILHDEDSPAADPDEVVAYVPNAVIGTQRRRLR